MSKLDIWRWAHYTLVGFFVFFIYVLVYQDHWQFVSMKIACIDNNTVTFLIFACGGYLTGMIVWGIAITFRNVITWPLFIICNKMALGTRDYHAFRVELLKDEFAKFKIKSTSQKSMLYKHINPLDKMSNYRHILLEIYRTSDNHKEYLGGKLISSWQSCSLMLCLMTVLFAASISTIVCIIIHVLTGHQPETNECILLCFLVIAYILTGISFLQRNRLLIRDLVLSYTLRSNKLIDP